MLYRKKYKTKILPRMEEKLLFSLWYLTPNIPKWFQNLWSRSHTDSTTHQYNLQTLRLIVTLSLSALSFQIHIESRVEWQTFSLAGLHSFVLKSIQKLNLWIHTTICNNRQITKPLQMTQKIVLLNELACEYSYLSSLLAARRGACS